MTKNNNVYLSALKMEGQAEHKALWNTELQL